MDKSLFWSLVDEARSGASDDDDFLGRLEVSLKKLSPTQLVEFERDLHVAHTQSYSRELWGAAFLAMGGCSDDGFDYFRAWLISQGSDRFATVCSVPDAISELPDGPNELEDLLSLAREVYEDRMGEELPDEAYAGVVLPDLSEAWDFDNEDEMRSRYPRAFAKFSAEPSPR